MGLQNCFKTALIYNSMLMHGCLIRTGEVRYLCFAGNTEYRPKQLQLSWKYLRQHDVIIIILGDRSLRVPPTCTTC
jgi:hypothetical protein